MFKEIIFYWINHHLGTICFEARMDIGGRHESIAIAKGAGESEISLTFRLLMEKLAHQHLAELSGATESHPTCCFLSAFRTWNSRFFQNLPRSLARSGPGITVKLSGSPKFGSGKLSSGRLSSDQPSLGEESPGSLPSMLEASARC